MDTGDQPKASAQPTFVAAPSPEIGSPAKREALRIALVGAAAFVHACKLEGLQVFQLDLSATKTSAHLAKVSSVSPNLVDLENVPKEYHNFADVFSKAKANTPAPH